MKDRKYSQINNHFSLITDQPLLLSRPYIQQEVQLYGRLPLSRARTNKSGGDLGIGSVERIYETGQARVLYP